MSALASLDPGEHRLACPECSRGPKDKTFGVTVEHSGGAVGHCFRCEYVESYRPDRPPAYRPGKPASRAVAPMKRASLSQYGLELFGACSGLRGTVGASYLQARGCVLPRADGDLRFHPALRHYPSGYVGPALVALLTDAVDRTKRTLHRTWINPDGTKAAIDPPRMQLGGHRKAGAVCRLWPDEAVTYGLAVTEGIETALSLALAYQPVWACIDAGNLAALPVLAGIETLVIGADNDDAGIKAAAACADRWAAAGVDVRVIAPAVERQDWNDARAAA